MRILYNARVLFVNRWVQELMSLHNYIHNNNTAVRNAIYSRVKPEPVNNPQVVAVSAPAMAECLDLSPEELKKREQDVAEYFGGAWLGWGLSRCVRLPSCGLRCVCAPDGRTERRTI